VSGAGEPYGEAPGFCRVNRDAARTRLSMKTWKNPQYFRRRRERHEQYRRQQGSE
jgi:hypothetical protein